MNEGLVNEDVVVTQQGGLMDSAKDYINPKSWLENIDLSWQRVLELAIYFGIGFVFGFLIKKYSKMLMAAVITVAGLFVLHYFGFITIAVHTERFRAVFGIQAPTLQTDVFAQYWEWIKINVALVVSLTVGFFVGLKVA